MTYKIVTLIIFFFFFKVYGIIYLIVLIFKANLFMLIYLRLASFFCINVCCFYILGCETLESDGVLLLKNGTFCWSIA